MSNTFDGSKPTPDWVADWGRIPPPKTHLQERIDELRAEVERLKGLLENGSANRLIEAMAMQAENMQRLAQGESPAYSEQAFRDLMGGINESR